MDALRPCLINTEEPIVDVRKLIGRYPNAGIGHNNAHVRVVRGHFDTNTATIGRVLDSILDYVEKRLMESHAIAGNGDRW